MIGEAIIGGFISKIINDCADISKVVIKKADKERKSKNQSLQSRIYQVIIDVLNKISSNQYKGQDIIYDAAENLLKGFKGGECDRIKVVKSGLQVFWSFVDDDKYEEFMEILRHEIAADENFDIYKEILLVLLEQQANDDQSKLQEIKEKLKKITKKINEKNIDSKNESVKQTVKSRIQEYADKWNSNMFLNDFDKRDENAGVNVKLSDVYLEEHLPHYIWGKNEKTSYDLKTLLSDYIDKKNGNNMLLILGQPGIGKSTLITWITANFTSRVDDIMVYQFAADLKDIDWQNRNIFTQILNTLGLSYDDLNEKTLILDGFDEVNIGGDRKEILDNIYWDLIKGRKVKNFSLIITCRENYINSFERIQCKYITLLPWDKGQIRSFCACYQEKTKGDISEQIITRVIENKEILGIPLILYMTLALNIAIEKEGSIVDIYDKIFSLEGGIYDRCIENRNFADNHRIGEIKEQIHQISREIAIWMFENNPVEAYISQKEYEKICDDVMKEYEQENEDLKQDFLIGNYFKLVKHCEGIGTEELYFVHRSIYEYFVAETIYCSIQKALKELSEESKIELAGNIAEYLKDGQITSTIGEYLQFKILKLYISLNSEKRERFYKWWEETFDMMMTCGMFYFTGNSIQAYENIILKETNCFVNLLKILRLLLGVGNQTYILENTNNNQFEKYIRLRLIDCKSQLPFGAEKLNLSKVWLYGIDLKRIDFSFIYLREANLKGADLRGVDLRGVNLIKTVLREADLRGADLKGANLREADLKGADLREANLYQANLEKSIWDNSNIQLMISKLKEANFDTLLKEDDNKLKEIHRSELFPDENNTLKIKI